MTTDQLSLRCTLPAGWFVGSRSEPEAIHGRLANGVVDKVARERLYGDVNRAVESTASRGGSIVLGAHPDVGLRDRVVVAGVLAVDPAVDLAELRQAIDAKESDPELLTRSTDLWGVSRSRVLVAHEVRVADRSGVSLLQERCVAYRRLGDATLRLDVATTDLDAFADMPATCARVVRGVDFHNGDHV